MSLEKAVELNLDCRCQEMGGFCGQNEKQEETMIRHGDVQLVKVKEIPKDVKLLKNRKELAFGEVTGHAHRIDVGDLFEAKDGGLFLKVERLATLTHEEHKAVKIKPGCYRIAIKRQYTPTGWEAVRD